MGYRFGSMREVKHLPEHLLPGEVVDFISGGRYGGDLGIVTLTDRRLLFLFHGVVRRRVEDFPLSKITSVLTKSRMMLRPMATPSVSRSSLGPTGPKRGGPSSE